jgi:hypothetical protein
MILYPSGYFFAILPIPLVLLVALILIKLRPPSKVIAPWKELDEPDKWWEKKEAAPPVSTSQQPQSTGVTTEEIKSGKPKEGSWWQEEEKDKKPSKEPTSPW